MFIGTCQEGQCTQDGFVEINTVRAVQNASAEGYDVRGRRGRQLEQRQMQAKSIQQLDEENEALLARHAGHANLVTCDIKRCSDRQASKPLGISVAAASSDSPGLSITEVDADGLIAEWNVQQPHKLKTLDCIVSVNGFTQHSQILETLRDADELSMQVLVWEAGISVPSYFAEA
eukprot:TRINITY_DN111013_c0_g1_i1.p1 TRINITY_DN111013_c0_g1~~TRINITY_DN111013_c0_g1_i1.p1  ORF type:complete len:184 (+),score=24.33 TRINITY_DN111013_c0_g1_i1:30-554(+)